MGLLDFELYVVTGEEFSAGRSTSEVVQAAIDGGAGYVLEDENTMGAEIEALLTG